MTGSEQDNSIVETTALGEETESINDSSSSVDEQKAADDAFLTGLEGSDGDDGSKETDSDSKKDDTESNKTEYKEDSSKANLEQKSSGRPDKRQRQINELIAVNAEKDRELEQFRRLQAEANQAQLPQADEDGNVTVEQMAEYQKQLAENIATQKLAEYERRTLQAEDQRNQTMTLSEVNRVVSEARGSFKALNKADAENYNPKVDAFVTDRVKDALAPFVASGSRDYGAIIETVDSTIKESMNFIEEVGTTSANNARKNLDSIRNSSALVSQDAGDSLVDDDDDFLKGFLD